MRALFLFSPLFAKEEIMTCFILNRPFLSFLPPLSHPTNDILDLNTTTNSQFNNVHSLKRVVLLY